MEGIVVGCLCCGDGGLWTFGELLGSSAKAELSNDSFDPLTFMRTVSI